MLLENPHQPHLKMLGRYIIPSAISLGSKICYYQFLFTRNLAIGIGIQNFPEGLAVSLPLRGAGMSVWKSFWYVKVHCILNFPCTEA